MLVLVSVVCLLALSLMADASCPSCGGAKTCPPKHNNIHWTFSGTGPGLIKVKVIDSETGESIINTSKNYPKVGPPPPPSEGDFCAPVGRQYKLEIEAIPEVKDSEEPYSDMGGALSLIPQASCDGGSSGGISVRALLTDPVNPATNKGYYTAPGSSRGASGHGTCKADNGSVFISWGLGITNYGERITPLNLELTGLDANSYAFERVQVPTPYREASVKFYNLGKPALESKLQTPNAPYGEVTQALLDEVEAIRVAYSNHPNVGTAFVESILFQPAGTNPVFEVLKTNNRVSQIVTGSGLTKIDHLMNQSTPPKPIGYTLTFYPPNSYEGEVGSLRQIKQGAVPTSTWCVDDPSPTDGVYDSLRLRESPGVQNQERTTLWTLSGSTWTMSTDNGNRSVVKQTTAEGSLRVETVEHRGIGGVVKSRSVEKFDQYDRLVRSERGGGGTGEALEWTDYIYTANSADSLQGVQRSDGSFEKYFYPTGNEDSDLYKVVTARPWGDLAYASASQTSGHITEWTRARSGFTTTETTDEKINATLVSKVVKESVIKPHIERITTKTFPSGSGTYAQIYSERYGMGTDSRMAGKIKLEQNADGTFNEYFYSKGIIGLASNDFIEDANGPCLETRIRFNLKASTDTDGHPIYLPMQGRSYEQTVVTNSEGNKVLETKAMCASGMFEQVSRITHIYDSEGRLTSSLRDMGQNAQQQRMWRSIYSATWVNDVLEDETDETGIITDYSGFDALGNPQTVSTAAKEGLANVPLEERHQTFDSEGRVVSEYSGSTGQNVNLRTATYNNAGRLTGEIRNGVRYVYERTNTPQGGLRETVLAGSAANAADVTPIKVTDYFRDGRIKSVSGSSVVAEIRTYALVGTGIQETINRGSGLDTVVLTTTSDSSGRIMSEKIPAPGGVMRTFTYYNDGRLQRESVNGAEVRLLTYSAPDAASVQETEIVRAAPSDDRTNVRTTQFAKDSNNVWWQVTETNDLKSMEKLGPFTGEELAVRREIRKAGSTELATVTTTETREPSSKVSQVVRVEAAGIDNSTVTILRNGKPFSVRGADVAAGSETMYTYDLAGRISLVEDKARNLWTSTDYDSVSGQPSYVRTWGVKKLFGDATAKTETFNTYYPPLTGSPASWANPVSSWGRLKSSTKDGATPTYFAYTERGENAFTWGNTYPTWTEYDAAGRLSRLHTYRNADGSINFYNSTWPSGAGPGDTTSWTYHSGTELVNRKLDASGNGPTFYYNGWGRMYARTNAQTNTNENFSYDLAGMLTSAANRSFVNDAKGRVTWISADTTENDPYAHTIFYEANGSYITDTATNPLDATAGTHVVKSIFDPLGRQIGVEYTYTPNGGSSQLILKDQWSYGAKSKMQSISSNGGVANWGHVDYTYTGSTDWLQNIQFKSGPGGSINLTATRTPDDLGRLTTTSTIRGDSTMLPTAFGKFDYTYGAVDASPAQNRGKREKATLANDAFWKYEYNERGEVTSGSKKWWGGLNESVAGAQFAYNFDAIGNRTSTTINGQSATYTPNNLNQYTSRTIPGVVDVTGSFSDDSVSVSPNAAGLALTVHTETSGTSQKQFHRQLTVNNSSGPVWQPVDVIVVKSGGIEGEDEIRKEQRHAFVSKSPEASSYDKEGNLKTSGSWIYGWSLSNRLLTASRSAVNYQSAPGIAATYGYDRIGRRVSKQVVETVITLVNGSPVTTTTERKSSFVWDGWRLIAEWDTTLTTPVLLRTYHWGVDMSGTMEGAGGVGGLLAMVDHTAAGGPKTYHYVYDGNGNVVALFDRAANTVAAEYEYGPFGEGLRASGSIIETNPFRFSTKYHDTETGLLYYGFRFYEPNRGRWINRDPIQEEGGKNLCAFVLNDPIGFVDELGLRRNGNQDYNRTRPWTLDAFDARGQDLFGWWMEGTGDTRYLNDGVWRDYMMENKLLAPQIREKMEEDAKTRVSSGPVSLQLHQSHSIEIEDGYFTGYEMLHGTNKLVGGFTVLGTAVVTNTGGKRTVEYKVAYAWHDRIDPMNSIQSDRVAARTLRFLFSPKDYNVHIDWWAPSKVEICGDKIQSSTGWPFDKKR